MRSWRDNESFRLHIDIAYHPRERRFLMNITKIIIWEEDGAWLGYLQDYPDYWTQGDTLDDLKEHLTHP